MLSNDLINSIKTSNEKTAVDIKFPIHAYRSIEADHGYMYVTKLIPARLKIKDKIEMQSIRTACHLFLVVNNVNKIVAKKPQNDNS